jgi:hypothetical protein
MNPSCTLDDGLGVDLREHAPADKKVHKLAVRQELRGEKDLLRTIKGDIKPALQALSDCVRKSYSARVFRTWFSQRDHFSRGSSLQMSNSFIQMKEFRM